MIDLSNQVALITGGTRGIGAATALLCARAGADVVIAYRKNASSARKIAEEIRLMGRNAFAVKCRIEHIAECTNAASAALERFARIDILVNSAGVWEYGDLAEMTPKEWQRSIDVNLTGTFNMCKAVLPAMKRQEYGRIINVSSTAGQRGEAYHSHYAASKGGVIAFTKSLGVELIRDGIWVNCVAPGWVDTDMVAHILNDAKAKKEIEKGIPRGRVATPEEIAGPILFLASSLSDHIVGEVLNVNGGSVLCG